MLAGKLLQKKEVCNKPGTYSSQRQRADVVQEYCDNTHHFRKWLSMLSNSAMDCLVQEFDDPKWIFLVIDHTDLPVTLSHLKTPPVNAEEPQPLMCPHCDLSFTQPSLGPPMKRCRNQDELTSSRCSRCSRC